MTSEIILRSCPINLSVVDADQRWIWRRQQSCL